MPHCRKEGVGLGPRAISLAATQLPIFPSTTYDDTENEPPTERAFHDKAFKQIEEVDVR